LESLIYGISASFMIISVICWFSCYMQIVTSDKFIYLFSKISKKLSLFFSMILRFVPLLLSRLSEVYNIQKLICFGKVSKLKIAMNSFFITTSWAIENAIITSDSMKSRGYELKGRTNYSNYKFGLRDAVVLLIIFVLFFITMIFVKSESLYIRYFPAIKISTSYIGIIVACVLLFLPEIINLYYKRI